jgi:hypothetical protein
VLVRAISTHFKVSHPFYQPEPHWSTQPAGSFPCTLTTRHCPYATLAGCRDYSPVLTLGTTLRCWEAIGLDRARDYMHATLTAAVAVQPVPPPRDPWSTHTFEYSALEAGQRSSSFALVIL